MSGSKTITLINPKFTEEVPIYNIPVPLVYLGSWLTSKGYKVEVVDMLHKEGNYFIMPNSDVVGLTVMSTQIPNALEVSSMIKILRPEVPIIWGGVHPTLYPEQVDKNTDIDYTVVGEGEYPIINILEELSLPGIIPSPSNISIDSYPKINWGLVRQACKEEDLRKVSRRTEFGVSLLTSRGCPYKCTFCINSILNIRYRRRDINLVLDDIKDALAQGIERIQFEDEDFFADKKRIETLIKGINNWRLKFRWAASARVSHFTDGYLGNIDFLKELKNCGLYFIGTGAESGSQRILNKIDKGIKVEDTLRMAECLSKAGLDANYSFMIGLPGETVEDYRKTLNLVGDIIKIDKRFYTLGPQIYRPYPGSKLFEECIKAGLEVPSSLEEWAQSPYIHSEFSSNPHFVKKYYPWIDYKGDLSTIVFYSTLMGLRPRLKLVTWALRGIGKIRCSLFLFRLPLLQKLYTNLRGSALEKLLRRLKIA